MTEHRVAALGAILAFWIPMVSEVVEAQAAPTQPRDTVAWQPGTKHSDQVLIQGAVVRVVFLDSVVVSAWIGSNENPMPIEVMVMNRSSRRFNVIPKEFSLLTDSPTKPLLQYVSPEQIAKKIENDAAWAMVAEGIASVGRSIGGTSTTQVQGKTTGPGGTTQFSGTATTRDRAANDALTSGNMNAIANSAEEEKAAKLSGAMLANTLFSGGSLTGRVHFKKDRSAKALTLCVPIEARIACIPLDAAKK
jgi:hypothetical protein